MEDIRNEQIEALQTLREYNVKIVNALKEISVELKGEIKEDTDEYFNEILKGLNWEIEVINGTMSFINEKEELISKESVNNIILELNESIKLKDCSKIAEVMGNQLLTFFSSLDGIIEKVLG